MNPQMIASLPFTSVGVNPGTCPIGNGSQVPNGCMGGNASTLPVAGPFAFYDLSSGGVGLLCPPQAMCASSSAHP